MKKLIALLPFIAVACESAPKIISDDHIKESPIIQGLRHDIENNYVTSNWGWVLWYLPFLALVLAWAYREFIVKRKQNNTHTAAKKLKKN